MKKLFLVFMVLLFSSFSLFAQRPGISVGGNVVFPIGNWAEVASIGYGGSATYEHPINRDVSGIIYSGYTYFGGKNDGYSWSMIPLVVGAKAYLNFKHDWYFAGLIGVNFATYEYLGWLNEGSQSVSSTEFAFNANFGYELKTSEDGALDISAGYVYLNEQNYVGVRIAYIFKL